VDVVIAMDSSFNPEDDQILRLRQHPINLDELAPVIRLVTVNSAEHVRLCLPIAHEIPSDRNMLQGLISATTILRNFNGVEIMNDNERYQPVAEYIRSKGQTEVVVFGIRDIEGYMAGHRGLAGLALKRARDSIDEQGGDRKRVKSTKPTWQVKSHNLTANISNLQWNQFEPKMTNFMIHCPRSNNSTNRYAQI
jgi:Class II histone deacetylase complex subunits 2 and 3